MSEALALRGKGPSGWCRAALLVCVAAASLVSMGIAAGCAPPAAPLPAVPPGVPPEPDAERLASLEAALGPAGSAADSVAATAMRAAGLTPPFERRFILDAAAGPLAVGLIPGGDPAFRDSLVVVVALGPGAGSALLESTRWIAERAAYHHLPARTLMIALSISNGSVESDVATALSRALSVPVWDPAGISGVVMVGPGAEAGAGAVAERGLAYTAVDHIPGTTTSALALRAYEAMLEALAGHGAAGPDTVATRE